MCIKCTNAEQTITHDNWIIHQSYCPGSLSSTNTLPGDLTFNYSSTTPTATIGDHPLIFSNDQPTNCPITACYLKT